MHEVVPKSAGKLVSPTKVSHEFGHKPATETLLYPLWTYDPKKRNIEKCYLILSGKQNSGLYVLKME